jgi:hypothetical protein
LDRSSPSRETSSRRRSWSDRQTGQQEVSKSFGIAHAGDASDFDQLVSEDCLQTFVAVKVDRAFVSFDHCERSVAIYFTVRQLPLPAVAP